MFLKSPLEQFEIIVLKPYFFQSLFESSFTNSSLFLLFATVSIFAIFFFALFLPQLIPHRFQLLAESSFVFITNVVKQQAGPKALRYLPLFYAIFLIILFSNLVGLLPFAFTPTSHIAFTLTIALSCNIALIIIGFYENGKEFLQLFVPKGGPAWLIPLIVVIEFLSYLLRTLSLSIRLFANMMAGHTLLHILSSFITGFLKSGYLLVSIFPFLLVVAVIVLELGIAFLQAYVFIILLSIYLNDSFHPSH
jgi:F-type H+-transporting ATPase subunit a